MTHLRLFLLGAPRVEVDDNEIDLHRRKVLAPLIYLAVTRQRHRRDTLATLFWPESDQTTARASLRREFYTLTSSLGNDWFAADRESIGLAPEAKIWVDVEEFRQQLALCREHEHPADVVCEECLEQLVGAMQLYTGDFLAGFTLSDCPEFDDWQFFQAESLRRELAGILEKLVGWYGDCGEYEPAITYARRWLTLDTLHEPVHRTLMRLYALAGQQAAAVRQYQECLRILDEELGVEPEAETTQLYEAIRTRQLGPLAPAPDEQIRDSTPLDAAPRPLAVTIPAADPAAAQPAEQAQRPPNNLPSQLTPFIGRTQELAAICNRLSDPACRLLTLIGPGGMGKTRLALETAKLIADREVRDNPQFTDGVYFVPLATVGHVSEMLAPIADAVGLNLAGSGSLQQQLLDHLHEKRLLLVLDNFEQLLAANGEGAHVTLLSTLLAVAPGLKLLVTSREALNLQEEWFHQIEGLGFPSEQETLAQAVTEYDAVRLFEQCAQRARGAFSLAEEQTHVVRICRLVEGMPLALELAAAWLKVLTTEQIAAEIAQNLDILTARHQNVPERHRSLRIVFEQSWQRLTKEEQLVLSKLAMFQDGCTRDAAARVAGGTIVILAALVDKALLRRYDQPLTPGKIESRFHFHPLLQQYVTEKLQTGPEVQEHTAATHAHYYLNLVELYSKQLKSAERKTTLRRLEIEFANLRAAWHWATALKDVQVLARFALPLSNMFEKRVEEGLLLFAQAAACLDETNPAHHAALGAVLVAQAEQVMRLGYDPAQSITLTERALALFQSDEAPHEHLKALSLLGNAFWLQGDYQRAQAVLEEGLAFLRTHGMLAEIGDFLIRRGLVERELHEAPAVMAFYQKSLAELRTLGDAVSLAHQLLIYGEYLVVNDQLQEGKRLLEESLTLVRAAGGTDFFPFVLMHLGFTAYKLGDYPEAEGYLYEVLTIAQAEARTHPEALAHIFLGRVKVAQQALVAAEQHLVKGLDLGWRNKLTLVATLALVCFAELYTAQGQLTEAVVLLTAALAYPATEQRDKQAAAQQLAALQDKLAPDAFAAAVARGNASSLDEIVTQLLPRG